MCIKINENILLREKVLFSPPRIFSIAENFLNWEKIERKILFSRYLEITSWIKAKAINYCSGWESLRSSIFISGVETLNPFLCIGNLFTQLSYLNQPEISTAFVDRDFLCEEMFHLSRRSFFFAFQFSQDEGGVWRKKSDQNLLSVAMLSASLQGGINPFWKILKVISACNSKVSNVLSEFPSLSVLFVSLSREN